MHRPFLIVALLTAIAPLRGVADEASVLWSGKVQPIFDVQCVKCHGPIQQKSGLVLDNPDGVMKGGDDGQIVVPGKPDKSRLYTYLSKSSDTHMPPKKQLNDEQRTAIKDWINALAKSAPTDTEQPYVPRKFASVTEAIDVLMAESWKRSKVKPAAAVDDTTWCRRVYLDLAGRIPSKQELDDFVKSRSKSKRAELADRLLASPEYAVHMREIWDVFLMGRPKRETHEDRRKQNGWWKFLETSFASDRPWNATVRALLEARPDRPEDAGASWFLYERRNEHQQMAEAVAPIVYGTKIDCAQCHDHPLVREIKQAHYWGLVAAFNRSKNVEGTSMVGESAIGGFINFTNLKKESQPAQIALLGGPTIEEIRPSGDQKEKDSDDKYVDPKAKVRVPKFSRREAFAGAATGNNPLLAKAFVNRMWAALLGRGIVVPVDEINARNAPSQPELLQWLSADFAANKFDVRRFVRGVVLSRVYALGPGKTAPELFAGAQERPLTGEQIARSWRVATGFAPDDDALRRKVIAAIPDVMPRDYNATFMQAKFLTSSPELEGLLRPDANGTVARLAAIKSAKDRAREAFEAIYAREPDSKELKETASFLGAQSDTAAGARDLVWALLTSAEFLTSP